MMEENENLNKNEELYSKAVRAGKRTYFFDVKTTKADEKYLTITESKRRFSNELNRFQYEKHKIFLYKEDFEKFAKAVNDSINYIATGEFPEDYNDVPVYEHKEEETNDLKNDTNIDDWFNSLDKEEK